MAREMNETEKKIASRLRSIEKLFKSDEANNCMLLVHANGSIYFVDRETEEVFENISVRLDGGDFDMF